MSVLLRQPHGFEGFGLRLEAAPPYALPPPPPAYQPGRLVHGSGATRAVAAKAAVGDRRVSEVVRFDNLDVPVGKDTMHVVPPAADSVVAAIAALALQGTAARDDLHVVVHQCQIGIEVTPVEGVDRSVAELHVLLRHSPRSIPQTQESA